jgi:hypothetical protein
VWQTAPPEPTTLILLIRHLTRNEFSDTHPAICIVILGFSLLLFLLDQGVAGLDYRVHRGDDQHTQTKRLSIQEHKSLAIDEDHPEMYTSTSTAL